MWLDGIALTVFFYFEFLVAAVCRVGKTFADDGVAHPEYKLLVLGIGDFGLVHPESVDAYTSCIGYEIPGAVGLLHAYFHGASVDEHHAVWRGFGPRGTAHSGDFAAGGTARAGGASAQGYGQSRGRQGYDCLGWFVHIMVYVVMLCSVFCGVFYLFVVITSGVWPCAGRGFGAEV